MSNDFQDPSNEAFSALRGNLFESSPEQLGSGGALATAESDSVILGVVAEMGMERGTALIFGLRSGAASMYTSTGGGVIGGEGHATVRAAARRSCEVADELVESFAPPGRAPSLPGAGYVTYSLLTPGGVRTATATATDDELREEAHPLHTLYAGMHGLLTALRQTQEASDPAGVGEYVNCLLTILSKSPGRTASIASGGDLPDLLALASNDSDREWVASMDFDYASLDAGALLETLDGMAQFAWLGRGSKGTLGVKHARPDGEVVDVVFDVVRTKVGADVGRLEITARP